MIFEYQVLALTSIFFLVAWVPVSIAKKKTFGLRWLASNRNPVSGKELPAWGQRAERAHNNLKDNFPAFITAILLLGVMGKFDNSTQWLSGTYLVARLGHYLAYTLGKVPFRALFYFTGLIANIILLAKIL